MLFRVLACNCAAAFPLSLVSIQYKPETLLPQPGVFRLKVQQLAQTEGQVEADEEKKGERDDDVAGAVPYGLLGLRLCSLTAFK